MKNSDEITVNLHMQTVTRVFLVVFILAFTFYILSDFKELIIKNNIHYFPAIIFQILY